MEKNQITINRYQSPLGEMLIGEFCGRLCLCDWAHEVRHSKKIDRLIRHLNAEIEQGSTSVITSALQQLDEYFKGKREVFDLPLTFAGTEFQKAVWQQLLSIPYGHTITYAHQAMQLGKTKAIRAVASANGDNALSIIVPCHRVIGSNGKLTGYSGGIDIKSALLNLESQVAGTTLPFGL